MARAGHQSRVTLLVNSPEGKETGILMDSVVMTDNLATVRESEIDRTLGMLSNTTAIHRALRYTLGL
jgi:mRNA interferase MazF